MNADVIDNNNISLPVKKERLMDLLFRKESLIFPKEGEIVEGIVIKKEGSRVFIDLGYRIGIIFGREYQLGRYRLRNVKEGDAVTAKIIETENEEGYFELSVSEADREKVWKEIHSIKDEKIQISLKAQEANKGGLVFEYSGIKGFLPVSQLATNHYPRVEGGDKNKILEELQKFIGSDFNLIVLDYSQRDNKLIFSEKGNEPDEAKKRLESYHIGDELEGSISGVVEFGIFVKLEDNLEGLVHISELDWSLVEDPSEHFKEGDKVKVKVIGIEGDKISLSVKALKPDPWKQADYQKGDIIEGKVTKFSKIGAFVQIIDKKKPEVSGKIYGLSHVSEFGSKQKMESIILKDSVYPFQIAVFEPDTHKLSLLYLGEGMEGKEIGDVKKESATKKEEIKEEEKENVIETSEETKKDVSEKDGEVNGKDEIEKKEDVPEENKESSEKKEKEIVTERSEGESDKEK